MFSDIVKGRHASDMNRKIMRSSEDKYSIASTGKRGEQRSGFHMLAVVRQNKKHIWKQEQ